MSITAVPAGEFKAKCLKLLDAVAATGTPLTVTKRGRPVARVVPIGPEQALFGALAGSVTDQRDIVAPIDEAWEAAR